MLVIALCGHHTHSFTTLSQKLDPPKCIRPKLQTSAHAGATSWKMIRISIRISSDTSTFGKKM
jgi:hypothetical protein